MPFNVCRLCLAYDVRMIDIEKTQLQEFYEKLSSNLFKTEDERPLVACYICHSQLKRCYSLIEKSLKAEELLTQIVKSGTKLTKTSLDLIDRQKYKLAHNISISPIEVGWLGINVCDSEAVVRVKAELPISYEKDIKQETEIEPEVSPDRPSETDEPTNQETDSDDDIPLKKIQLKNTKKKISKLDRVRISKGGNSDIRGVRGLKIDAKEILLTPEEQMQELLARAKTLNYLNSPFKCSLCYKGFVDARAYENHKDKHSEKNGEYTCEICKMRYPLARQLRTHRASAHARRYTCNKCDHTSHTVSQAREHERWHKGHLYECQLCSHKSKKPTSYLTHMRKCHPTEHICNICGESFVGRHGLHMHKIKTHKRDDETEGSDEPATDRFCADCNIQFVNLKAWKRHILSSLKHTRTNENGCECRICGVRVLGDLSSHMTQHRKELKRSRPTAIINRKVLAELSCDECGMNFINRSKLQAHVKRIHLGLKYNKNMVCEVCGKKCSSNASLKTHQRVHTGERPHECSACHKRFTDANQLRIHTRTHTGERPYCCAACGKRFSQKPALNRHYRVHTGAKPYECQFCSKSFSQSNSLKIHVRTIHLKLPPNNKKKTSDAPNEKESLETGPVQNL